MVKQKPKNKFLKTSKKQIFYLILVILLGVAIIPNINQLVLGISTIKNAQLSMVLLSISGLIGAYLASASVYVALANPRLNFTRTVAVQTAASFANRILPGGVGGISLNIDYLLKSGHNAAGAASITAMNSIVSLTSHLTLIFIAALISQKSFSSLWSEKTVPIWTLWIVVAVAVAVIVTFAYSKKIRRKALKITRETIDKLLGYRRKPWRLVRAFLGATMVTLFLVFTFWACAQAVGLTVSLTQTFIIYTLGVIVGAAVMTPGGLGGVEAGMVAALLAYGESSDLAFSAVIIYRLITFWLPILPGYICFWWLRRKRYI